jgi:undecaprenyl-diphosphatase
LGLLVFTILAVLVERGGPVAFDPWVTEALGPNRHGWFRTVMAGLSAVTRATVLGPLTLLGALAVWRAHRRAARLLVFSFVGAGVLNQLLKWTWQRQRPARFDALYPIDSFSFPSGHAMLSMACWLAGAFVATRLVARAERARRWDRLVWWLGGALVAGVGLSRVYLQVHYATDVIAGWALGAAWVLLLEVGPSGLRTLRGFDSPERQG